MFIYGANSTYIIHVQTFTVFIPFIHVFIHNDWSVYFKLIFFMEIFHSRSETENIASTLCPLHHTGRDIKPCIMWKQFCKRLYYLRTEQMKSGCREIQSPSIVHASDRKLSVASAAGVPLNESFIIVCSTARKLLNVSM